MKSNRCTVNTASVTSNVVKVNKPPKVVIISKRK